MLITIVDHPAGTMRIVASDGQTVTQRAVAGCERCTTDAYVPHFSCMYAGKAMGHSEGHCTANACY